MNQQQAALIVKLGLTDEQIGVMFPDVAPRHYGVVREWGRNGGDLMMKIMRGEVIQLDEASFEADEDYSLAPRTVTITGPGGTFEIPEPVREPLDDEDKYWVAFIGEADKLTWCNDDHDHELLAQGRIHLTEEAAQAHADALAKLMGVQS